MLTNDIISFDQLGPVIYLMFSAQIWPSWNNKKWILFLKIFLWVIASKSLIKPKIKKMCVSGYPTMPNFSSPTLKIFKIIWGFPCLAILFSY